MDLTAALFGLFFWGFFALYVTNHFRKADKIAKLSGRKYTFPEECCACNTQLGTQSFLVTYKSGLGKVATSPGEAIISLTLPDIDLQYSVPICPDCKEKTQGFFPRINEPVSLGEDGSLKFNHKGYEQKWITLNNGISDGTPLPRKMATMWVTLWIVHAINVYLCILLGSVSALLFQIGLIVGTVGVQVQKKWGVYIFGGDVVLGILAGFAGIGFFGYWGLVYLGVFIYLWREGEFS